MSGFGVIYREVADHPLFAGDAARLGAWAWLILKACWKPTPYDIGGRIVALDRGQLCASRAQLAKAWGWSPSAVERFLTRLETEQMIGRATGQGRTIITVCNYAKYQDFEEKAGQATGQAGGQRPDSDRTTKEQGNQETKDIPSAKADGRDAPAPLALDLAASLFRTGLILLEPVGYQADQARRIVGKWRKTYSDSVVLVVMARAQTHRPENPVEWITRGLRAEAERAAGKVSYHQPPVQRRSVREIGMRLAREGQDSSAERVAEPAIDLEEQRRLIGHGG